MSICMQAVERWRSLQNTITDGIHRHDLDAKVIVNALYTDHVLVRLD